MPRTSFQRGRYRVLAQEMADLTAPECATVCRPAHSCCDELYCDIAREYARQEHDVVLQPAGYHARLPFMGPTGCVVEPYLRPLCTGHTCEVNNYGFKVNDPGWSERYFELRERLNEAMAAMSVDTEAACSRS
jgi:hypothetical protein